MSDPKNLPHPHEINILKNVIEKAEGLSARLKEWAENLIAEITAEKNKLEAEFRPHSVKLPPLPETPQTAANPTATAAANGLALTPSTPTPSADENLEPMTVEEMRATGHYTEDEIKALCEQEGVEYVAPVPVSTEPATDTAAPLAANASPAADTHE